MLAVGVTMAFAWSSVSQFLVPLRGTREFGLERGGISLLLALAQVVDLIALLPAGRLADRVGRLPVLAAMTLVLGLGAIGTGLLIAARLAARHLIQPAPGEMARAGGGHANLEWAPLAVKSQIPVWDDPGAAGRIMERIKAQLDPRNILNPGRFVAGI
jgi:glycolate oxidase FAD binding subunit